MPGRLDHPHGVGPGDQAAAGWRDGHRDGVPAPRRAGQHGGHARHRERGPARPRPRRGVERRGVRRLRHRAGQPQGALRSLRGGPRGDPRAADVDHDHLPGPLLPPDRGAVASPRPCRSRTRRSSSAGAASGARCPSWRSGPTTGTPGDRASTTSRHKRSVLHECCARAGRDPSDISISVIVVEPDPAATADKAAAFGEAGADIVLVRPTRYQPAEVERMAERARSPRPLTARAASRAEVVAPRRDFPQPEGQPRAIRRVRPEVLEVPARRRAPLALVLRAGRARPVGMVGRRRHLQEADLADLHARVDRDRQAGHVRQLERDVPVEAGVDEAGRGVDQQPEPAERALALEPRDEVVGRAATRSSVDPSTNSPGWRMKTPSSLISTSSVRSP